MSKNNDMLVTLIKEVVKNEVNRQIKEEVAKLIKSGVITLNKDKKPNQSLIGLTEEKTTNIKSKKEITNTNKKIFTKNSVINEILNTTTPFTSAERAEGGMPASSVLDMIKRDSEEDWGTISMNTDTSSNINHSHQTGDALTKALTRDYSELVKKFK